MEEGVREGGVASFSGAHGHDFGRTFSCGKLKLRKINLYSDCKGELDLSEGNLLFLYDTRTLLMLTVGEERGVTGSSLLS